jgi:RNA polymerase sigma factor (sigma-70 family)
MAGARLGVALRHIQRLYSDGSAAGATDTQLLAQFAGRRDETAFAALMARHGPMVMTVCRGVLRDSLDAEDAFQATFIVLARKAGSTWAEGQLGGWLHRVAYRVAIRAKIDAARRRTHEHQAAEVAAMEISLRDSENEIQPALHEELARLPAKLRLPIVLCYLEGLTHAQAALQLRCGEATLRRRLAGARDRLRSRLLRRGFAPTASIAVLSIAREAAAVSPAVAEATLGAAVRVAVGEAIAAVAGTRMAVLSTAGLTTITECWKTTAYAALAVAALACAGAGIAALGRKDAGGSTRVDTEPVAHPQAGNPRQAQSPPRDSSFQKHAIHGMVFAPDGKPLADATVFWVGRPAMSSSLVAMPKEFKPGPEDRTKILAVATTDSKGRFELAAEFAGDRIPGRTVLVKAKGAGLSATSFFSDTVREGAGDDERLTFRLRKPVTIEGRLLTPAGAPAKGVKVVLEGLGDSKNKLDSESVGPWDESEDSSLPELWPKSWTTDADGRFRIERIIPENMFAALLFRHPDFADDDLVVSTGLPADDQLREFKVKPADARFTHALEPARPVTGIVTDKETGRPLAGVRIEMIPSRMTPHLGGEIRVSVKTDASGRYRAAGRAGDTFWVTACPDPASGYLPLQTQNNKWPVGGKVLNVDLALPKGRIVRGRVVDGMDGNPIVGASVVYQPGPNNSLDRGDYDFDDSILTDANGSFAITALPGDGLLAVEGPTPDYIRVAVTGPRTDQPIARPHGFAWINVPAAKDNAAADARITLRKGVKLEARLVGPDGAPVDMAMCWCEELLASQLENWVSPGALPDGRFKLDGADPERTYRVFFVHSKRKLGARAELKYDPKGPIIVPLQPTATARGIVVDEKGRPLKETQILPWIVLTKDDRELKAEDFDDESIAAAYPIFTWENLRSSYPAEFHYDNLIPGVRYYVGANESYHAIGALKPGEVRDLGKIVFKRKDSD